MAGIWQAFGRVHLHPNCNLHGHCPSPCDKRKCLAITQLALVSHLQQFPPRQLVSQVLELLLGMYFTLKTPALQESAPRHVFPNWTTRNITLVCHFPQNLFWTRFKFISTTAKKNKELIHSVYELLFREETSEGKSVLPSIDIYIEKRPILLLNQSERDWWLKP